MTLQDAVSAQEDAECVNMEKKGRRYYLTKQKTWALLTLPRTTTNLDWLTVINELPRKILKLTIERHCMNNYESNEHCYFYSLYANWKLYQVLYSFSIIFRSRYIHQACDICNWTRGVNLQFFFSLTLISMHSVICTCSFVRLILCDRMGKNKLSSVSKQNTDDTGSNMINIGLARS